MKIQKGDLFLNTSPDDYLLHACNAQGVWGSGIAAEFKQRFPKSYEEYRNYCLSNLALDPHHGATGTCFITSENIICLITSFKYGQLKDYPPQILRSTQNAIEDMLCLFRHAQIESVNIHSPMINSGLFAVPWDQTEAVISGCLKDSVPQVEWTVWQK